MWEYKIEVLDLQGAENSLVESEKQLDSLGRQGWEAVSFIPKVGKGDSWCLAVLKRQTRESQ